MGGCWQFVLCDCKARSMRVFDLEAPNSEKLVETNNKGLDCLMLRKLSLCCGFLTSNCPRLLSCQNIADA